MSHTYFLNLALPEFYAHRSWLLPGHKFPEKYIPKDKFLSRQVAVIVEYWTNDDEEIEKDMNDEMRELAKNSPTGKQLVDMVEKHSEIRAGTFDMCEHANITDDSVLVSTPYFQYFWKVAPKDWTLPYGECAVVEKWPDLKWTGRRKSNRENLDYLKFHQNIVYADFYDKTGGNRFTCINKDGTGYAGRSLDDFECRDWKWQ